MSSSPEVMSVFFGLVLFVGVVSLIKVVFNWKMTMGRLLSLAVLVLLVSIAHYANISKQVAASDTESQEAVTRQETTRQETTQQEQNLTVLRSAVDGDLVVCHIPRTTATQEPEVSYVGFVSSNTPERIVVTVLIERDRKLVFQPSTFRVDALARSDCVFQIVRGETLLKQMTR